MTTIEQAAEQRQSKRERLGLDGSAVAFVAAVVLRGLSHADRFADTPLRHFWVQLGLVVVIGATYALAGHTWRRLRRR